MQDQNQPSLSSDISQLLTRIGGPICPTSDKRRDSRIPQSLSLIIQPLNEDFRADGEPFWSLSRDISRKGLGFGNPEPIVHKHLRITIPMHNVTLICKVCHSTSIGTKYPVYFVGVQFLGGEQ